MFGHSRRPALLTVPRGANGVSQLDEAMPYGYDPDIVVPTATVDRGSGAAERYLLTYGDAPWSEGATMLQLHAPVDLALNSELAELLPR